MAESDKEDNKPGFVVGAPEKGGLHLRWLKWPIIALVAVALVGGCIYGGYKIFKKPKTKTTPSNSESTPKTEQPENKAQIYDLPPPEDPIHEPPKLPGTG